MKKLNMMPPYLTNTKRGPGPNPKYDWSFLLGKSGDIHEIVKGADYTCSSGVFGMQARNEAKKRDIRISIHKIRDPNHPGKEGWIIVNHGPRQKK